MKEVTRYKNEMNTLSIGKWTAENEFLVCDIDTSS